MKKGLVLLFALVMSISLLTFPLLAGGQKEGAEAKGVAKKVYFSSGETSPKQVKLFETLEQEYEALHPDIDIVYERLVTSMGPLFVAAMAAGVPKSVYNLGTQEVMEFWPQDVFLPLNDVVDDIGRDDFNPWAVKTMKGNDLAISYAGSMRVLLLRRDLLNKEGLEIPKTHAEFVEAARRLTRDNDGDGVIDVYGIGLPGSEGFATGYYAQEFLWQRGGQVFDKDLNITIDQPESMAGIATYVELLKNGPPGARTWTWSEHRSAYAAGRVAMAVMGGREPSKIGMQIPDIAAVTELAPLPYDKIKVNTGGADNYVVPKTCPNVEEAKEFLKWILTGDRALRFYSAVPGHLLPILKSQGAEFLAYVPSDPDASRYIKEHKDWLDVIFNECAPYAVDFSEVGVIQGGKVVPTNVFLPSELAARMYGEPALLSQVIYKVAWEGWNIEDAVAWGVEELEKVKAEM